LSLILGYNGLGRLGGQAGGPQAFGGAGGPAGGGGPAGAGAAGGVGGVFGGVTGPFRLLDASLGGQAGWLLGFAVVGGIAIVVASRLRRADARTGWLIAVAGAFATTAVAFSYAKGIFHPYYVSLLAPFTAALVGAGAGQLVGGAGELRSGDHTARILGPLAVAAGVATTLVVIADTDGAPGWVELIVLPVGALAAVALALRIPRRARVVALAAALGALMLAPAAWAVQTLGHATSGTFPAGGPTAQSGLGGPGGPGAGRGGFGGGGFRRGGTAAPGGGFAPPAGGGAAGSQGGGFAPPGSGGAAGSQGGGFAPPGAGTQGSGAPSGGSTATPRGGPGGGGPFGGESTALRQAVADVRAHGGGTVAASSQQGASATIIDSGADVAALGGFSGRESEVSVAWLADAVRAGRIRWVLTDGSGGGVGRDGRVGSSTVMAAVAQTCKAVSTGSSSSTPTSGLYDCQGRADALAALATTS